MYAAILLLLLSQDQDREGHIPSEAKEIIEEYQSEVSKLNERMEAKIKPIRDRRDKDVTAKAKIVADKLRKIQESESSAGRLESAVSIKRISETLGTGQLGIGGKTVVRAELPPTARQYKSHNYAYLPGPATWHRAKAICEQMGGHLATISDPHEMVFCASLTGGKYAWLGATDEGKEGVWEWVNGEPWHHNLGGMNNTKDEEHWLCMENATTWNDWQAGRRIGFICEWE